MLCLTRAHKHELSLFVGAYSEALQRHGEEHRQDGLVLEGKLLNRPEPSGGPGVPAQSHDVKDASSGTSKSWRSYRQAPGLTCRAFYLAMLPKVHLEPATTCS